MTLSDSALGSVSSVYVAPPIPQAFVRRRLHSLMGLWLSVYIIFHLMTNSQAALFIGDDGRGFIEGVNAIQNMPFLPILEMAILGVPILIHLVFGIQYLLQARYNDFSTAGNAPSLPQYSRNRAYTWQRITAWILAIALLAHIVHMRFLEHPVSAQKGSQEYYMIRINHDPGLITLADRLDFEIYNQDQVETQKEAVLSAGGKANGETLPSFLYSLWEIFQRPAEELNKPQDMLQDQKRLQDREWVVALSHWPLKSGEVIAVAKSFGTAELLMLRDTFKKPFMMVLYTIFVLTACFHSFNGLWTFLIKWGVTLTERSQKIFLNVCYGIMGIVAFLGLSAIWMTYWINLKQ